MTQPPLTRELVDRFCQKLREKYPLHALYISLGRDNDLKLDSLIVEKSQRSRGAGGKVMRALERLADAYGCRVTLSPGLPDDRHGTTSRARLVRFYKQFGFYENKGRRKDFTVSAGMIREPREPAVQIECDDVEKLGYR